MEFDDLIQFQKIAELEHLTRASFELHIAQPALSKTLRDLETEIGFQLFDRNGKNIKLNENGRIFLKYVNRILLETERVKQNILCARENKNSIVLLASVFPSYLSDLLSSFMHKYPHYQINLLLARDPLDYKKINHDFYLFSGLPFEKQDNDCEIVLTERIMLAVSSSSPIAKKKDIKLQELCKEAFIRPRKEYGLHHVIDYYFRLAKINPKFVLEYSSYSSMQEAITSGCGISIIPEHSTTLQSSPDISLINIVEPICTHAVFLQSKHKKGTHIICDIFQEYIKDYLSNL